MVSKRSVGPRDRSYVGTRHRRFTHCPLNHLVQIPDEALQRPGRGIHPLPGIPDPGEAARRVNVLLDGWQFKEAASELKALEAAAPNAPEKSMIQPTSLQ